MTTRTLRALWRSRELIDDDFRRDLGNRALFLKLFQQPHVVRTLRLMNQFDILGQYLPNFGRIVGQMLVYLYLWDGDCSLDQIGEELGLSKAAVSIAARQLENLGLIRRTWKQGDRRKYYRTVENIGVALRQGLLSLVRNKMEALAGELDSAYATIEAGTQGEGDAELRFLTARVRRAKVLRDRMVSVLGSPLLKLLLPGMS